MLIISKMEIMSVTENYQFPLSNKCPYKRYIYNYYRYFHQPPVFVYKLFVYVYLKYEHISNFVPNIYNLMIIPIVIK